MKRTDIRLALPSKGRLAEDALEFLAAAGLRVYRPNPRQYAATIPALPGLTIMFQRPGDIAVGVRQGSVDFGITGLDVFSEKCSADDRQVLLLHEALGFSRCYLGLAVPEEWAQVTTMSELAAYNQEHLQETGSPLRVATKFPALTGRFLEARGVMPYQLVEVEGTLEIAPAIGYADLISDLVSTGTTLRDNHLYEVEDGTILSSQAILIANRQALSEREEILQMARNLLEIIEAHLRAEECHLVLANVRSNSPEEISGRMATRPYLSGLQGPTVSPVLPNTGSRENGTGWYAINIVVRKDRLTKVIEDLRAIGGSGVVVTPVTYIFEEEPARYRAMLVALEREQTPAVTEESC